MGPFGQGRGKGGRDPKTWQPDQWPYSYTDPEQLGPLVDSLRKSSFYYGHWLGVYGHWLGVDYKANETTDTKTNSLGYMRWIAAMSMLGGVW